MCYMDINKTHIREGIVSESKINSYSQVGRIYGIYGMYSYKTTGKYKKSAFKNFATVFP